MCVCVPARAARAEVEDLYVAGLGELEVAGVEVGVGEAAEEGHVVDHIEPVARLARAEAGLFRLERRGALPDNDQQRVRRMRTRLGRW